MGTILAIVAYELNTTTVQGHQYSVNPSPKGESNTPEMYTDLISWNCPVGPLVEMEPEGEPILTLHQKMSLLDLRTTQLDYLKE